MSDDFSPFALVADDDPFVRMDAVGILETAGFRTYEASGVDEALAVLAAAGQSIQLLFTDVHMPPGPLDGFALARRCASDWPHIGILVSSGLADPGPGDMPEGATFVAKPFSADIVLNRLNELLPEGRKPQPLKNAAVRNTDHSPADQASDANNPST